MPCRAPATTLFDNTLAPVDHERALRIRIADLEDLLTLVDASADWADDGSIRTVLRDCLSDCRRRLQEMTQLH